MRSASTLITDAAGQPMRRPQAMMMMPQTAFDAAGRGSMGLADWLPSLGSADRDWLPDRDAAVARMREMMRNNGAISGAIRRDVDHCIGAGLRLQSMPDYRALGIKPEEAHALARDIEAWWRSFAFDPRFLVDVQRRGHIGALQRTLYQEFRVTGEALALVLWRPGRGSRWATCFQAVDTDRLSNPYGRMNGPTLRGGVERNADGAAIAYHIRKTHPHDIGIWQPADAMTWERVPRETSWGRPVAIHYYAAERPGQSRGFPLYATIIKRMRKLDQFQETELLAAWISSILMASITSPYDRDLFNNEEASSAYQNGRLDYHEKADLQFGGIRIPMLYPGEEIKFPTANRPNNAYPAFEGAVLRNFAAATGQSYMQVSQNWAEVNYSSARATLLDVWRMIETGRDLFASGICTPMFVAALEEAVDRGDLVLPAAWPDFYSGYAAYTACKWGGPARGNIDPSKEAEAADRRLSTRTTTLEAECADQGEDWEDTLNKLSREIALIDEPGLPRPAWALPGSGKASGAPPAAAAPADPSSGEKVIQE